MQTTIWTIVTTYNPSAGGWGAKTGKKVSELTGQQDWLKPRFAERFCLNNKVGNDREILDIDCTARLHTHVCLHMFTHMYASVKALTTL